MSSVFAMNGLYAHRFELALGANPNNDPATYTWIDVTRDVDMSEPIKETHGAGDEDTETNTSLAFTFRNASGVYTTDNAESPLYPLWRMGCPIRHSIDIGDGAGWKVRSVTFAGSISDSWPDGTAERCKTAVTAGGSRRRATQSKAVMGSFQRTISVSTPYAYWPLDDMPPSVSALSAVSGIPNMHGVGAFEFSVNEGPISAPGKYIELKAELDTIDLREALTVELNEDSGESFIVEYMLKATPAQPTLATIFPVWIETSDASILLNFQRREVPVQEVAEVVVSGIGGSSGFAIAEADILVFDSKWHHMRICVSGSGTTTTVDAYIDGELVVSISVDDVTPASLKRLGVAQVSSSADPLVQGCSSASVGHLLVWSGTTSDTYQAFNAYLGELAHTRISRICAEASFPYVASGTSTVALGYQSAGTAISAIQSAANADHGIITDSQGAISFRARSSMPNQVPKIIIDGHARELGVGTAPIDDDFGRRNRVIATRPNGGARVAENAASIAAVGLYEVPAEVNISNDAELEYHAQYLVGTGVQSDRRYGAVYLPLTSARHLAGQWLATVLGDRISLDNMPRQHRKGRTDQIIVGWSETWLGRTVWDVVLNTVSHRPYEVAVVDGVGNLGRVDADNSTLATAVDTPTATSLSVATSAGPLWATSGYPTDIDVNGERMSLTAVSGASSPQTFTVVRSLDGVRKVHAAGSTVKLWRAGVLTL